MFGKRKSDPTPAPTASTPMASIVREHCIGAGMIVYGALSFPGRLVVEGTVNGQIMGESGSEIVVAPGGMVEGPVSGGTVRVQGVIEGNVRAQNVYIEDGGEVEGNIEAGTLRTADGARVFGEVRTQTAQATEPAALAPPLRLALPMAVAETD